MPRTASPVRRQITQLLAEFADRVHKAVETHSRPTWPDDVRAKVLAALGMTVPKRPGRPPGSKNAVKAAAKAKPAPAAKAAPKAKRPLSPVEARARKLQGQYMGNMRSLSKANVAKVKAERAKNGIEAAIKMAQGFKKAA